jgi:hypothetical protein
MCVCVCVCVYIYTYTYIVCSISVTSRRSHLERQSNRATTSNSKPNTDPINIDHLGTKYPEPDNPESFLKWFSIPKNHQCFHTHSPVTVVDIDGPLSRCL